MKLFAIFCILIFSSNLAYSQLFYVNKFSRVWNENDTITRIELDYSHSTVISVKKGIDDLAISPSGIMYGIAHSKLVKINLENGHLDTLVSLPFGDYSESLVCGNDYNLYTLAKSGVLYAFDIVNDTLKLIDYLGADGRHARDITFYKGNIIFQGYANANFFAYNLQERDITRIFCNSMSWYDMVAIGNIVNICGEEMIYGITEQNEVYEIDFDHNTLIFLHFYGSVFDIQGGATSSEHLSSACNYHFIGELCNPVDVENSASTNDVKLYPNPADNVLFIEYDSEIEWINVYNSSGIMVKTFENPISPINVSNLAGGVYFFLIYAGGKFKNKIVSIK